MPTHLWLFGILRLFDLRLFSVISMAFIEERQGLVRGASELF